MMKNSLKDDLAWNSSILFVLMMLANIINFLFQIVLGRLLNDVELYGTMNALFSISNIVSLPFSIILMIVSKYVAEFSVCNEMGRIKGFINKSILFVLRIVIVLSLVGVIISPLINNYMKINSTALVCLVWVLSVVSYIIPVISGCFQGMKKFFEYGLISLITPFVKLIVSILFIFIGLKLFGVLFAMLLANLITIVIGWLWLRKLWKKTVVQPVNIRREKIVEYSYSTVMINVGLTLLTNLDMVLIKHYFVKESGYYGTALVFNKIVLYFTSAIVIALFPMVVERKKNTQQAFRLLKKSIVYGGSISIIATIGLNMICPFFIRLLYGDIYADAIQYIFPISMMILPLSLLTILANYALASEQPHFIMYSMIGACIAEVVLTTVFHKNLIQVIWIFAIIMFCILAINLVEITHKFRKE